MKTNLKYRKDKTAFSNERRQGVNLEDNRSKTVIQQKSTNPTGIPNHLKHGMENVAGLSLDHVKVHYNSAQPAQYQAHAFARGSEIHLASGQEKHLPHELGHVVQQAKGNVQATTAVAGAPVNDSPQLEKEADDLGKQALK